MSTIFQGKIRVFNHFHIIVFVFLLFNVASIFWTLEYNSTYKRIQTYLQIAIQVWMLWDLLTSELLFRTALFAFVLGAYIPVGDSIYNFLTSQIISQYEYGRFSGGGQNAVELALILCLTIPIAWHLAVTEKDGKGSNLIKAICYIFIPAALLSIILTASRTSILTLIPVMIFLISYLNRLKPVFRILLFFSLFIALFVGQAIIPVTTLERLGTIGTSISSGDLGGRVRLWQESLFKFQDHPLFGIGSGSLNSPNQLGTFAHNTFISITTELGIIGLLIFIAVIISTILRFVKQPKPLKVLWITELSIWLIGIQSLTWEYTKDTWFFLGLITISAGIYSTQIALDSDGKTIQKPGSPKISSNYIR